MRQTAKITMHRRWAMEQATEYPHEGGCIGCRVAKVCNACGGGIDSASARCANGRCLPCHGRVCTVLSAAGDGGVSPGHGYGRPPAVLAAILLAALGTLAVPSYAVADGCRVPRPPAGLRPVTTEAIRSILGPPDVEWIDSGRITWRFRDEERPGYLLTIVFDERSRLMCRYVGVQQAPREVQP